MTSTAIETALMIHVEQILEGEAKCCYCDRGATLTVATGADPDSEAVCGTHGARMLTATLHVVESLFVRPGTA